MLCVSYFLQNSNKAWNHLHISDPNDFKIFADSLINSSQQNSSCNILDVAIDLGSTQTKFFSSSFLCNITECYCVCTCTGFDSCDDKSISLFIELFSLSKLKVLVFEVEELSSLEHEASENCLKIKNSIQKNCVLEEMSLIMEKVSTTTSARYVTNVFKGMATNTKVESFAIKVRKLHFHYDTSEAVVCLLKENYTLKTLKLFIPFVFLSPESIPSALEVNTPLNSLSIKQDPELVDLIIQNCKSLRYLGCYSLQCSIPKLFQCHPCLQQLSLHLHTTDSVIELFKILPYSL